MGLLHWLHSGVMLVAGLSVVGSTVAAGHEQMPFDRFIVKFKATPTALERANPLAFQRMQQAVGVRADVQRTLNNGAVVIRMSESRRYQDWFDVMTQLSHDSDIAYIEPDLRMVPTADPLYSSQWYLHFSLGGINADSAWNYSTGEGAVVAVLDSGIRPHVDLVANTLPGYDFITDTFTANDGDGRDGDPLDPGDGVVAGACGGGMPEADKKSTWHGTHVSGLVAAASNGIGMEGVAYDADIVPLRVLGRCGGYTSDIADAIYWASGYSVPGVPGNANKADVINMSLSSSVTGSCSQTYSDAINAANAAGVTVVTSAGNSAANATDYAPGNCSGVINVAAINYYGDLASYSNTGSVVDLVAPGGVINTANDPNGIWSTLNAGVFSPAGDTYGPYQGTSMAAPQVAGVVALMRSVQPEASPAELEAALKDTTRDFYVACPGCGTGILDAEEAVKRILGLTVADAIADLRVALQADNGKFIDSGDGTGTIQYKVLVSNDGPDQASDLVLSNIFPPEVSLDMVMASPGVVSSLTDYSCAWSELESGASQTITFRVRTSNDAKMDFSASITGADTDPNINNNYATKKFGGGLGGMMLAMLALMWRRRQ